MKKILFLLLCISCGGNYESDPDNSYCELKTVIVACDYKQCRTTLRSIEPNHRTIVMRKKYGLLGERGDTVFVINIFPGCPKWGWEPR
jgi:hypothetical protein